MKKTTVLLLVLIALGIGFRLVLLHVGLTLDETVTVYVADSTNFEELIDRIRLYEFSPPLYFLMMNFWVSRFGDQAVTLAIPSMVLGVALIPAVYFFALEMYRRTDVALCASFYAAIAPLACFFSHESRLYALMAVLTSLTVICFVRSLRETTIPRVACLGVGAALMLYTHYVALLLIAMMFLVTILYNRLPGKSASFSLFPILGTFSAALLSFAAWFPVFQAHTSVGTYWVDKPPLINWPLVFVNNLAATLPLPWFPSAMILGVVLPITLLWASVTIASRARKGALKQSDLTAFVIKHKVTLFLIMFLVTPLSIFGYVTPFILGYCRYVLPFSVFAWTLCALLTVHALAWLGKRFNAQNWSANSTAITIALLAFAIALPDFLELRSLARGDRSGLRRFALDVKSGMYSSCALLMLPDYDSFTLIYYLTREQNAKLPEAYTTFPRPKMLTPGQHQGCAAAYQDREPIKLTMDWIKGLKKDGYECLAVVVDKNVVDSHYMPAHTRVDEMVRAISSAYARFGTVANYNCQGGSFDVYRFRLPIQKRGTKNQASS